LRELEKDYGMFDQNERMHMRNLNEQLSLKDVVNFHEIIVKKEEKTGITTILGIE